MTKVVNWALVLASMTLVLWIRTVPLSLPVTDDWADSIMQQRIYSRMAREVSQELPPSAWREQVDARAAQWIQQNKTQFESEQAAVSQRLKSELRYPGTDGQDHVYLGDFDSYLWLRHARNYLRTKTTCDAMTDGECRDTYANAPVGTRMIYRRSLHIAAIVGLHRFITLFQPDYPLPASSFWVPVIIGGLGVFPAFFLGQRLAGAIGGLFAAVLVGLHPRFLLRSIGSDNDVWNVVLPLGMMGAAVAALGAKAPRAQSVYSVLAAAFAGLHAVTWRGWIFTYVVLVTALLGTGLLQSLRYAIRKRTYRIWQAPEVRKIALVTVIFYAATGLFSTLIGSEIPYFALPSSVLEAVMGSSSGASPGAGDDWPDVLTTVVELLEPGLGGIVDAMGGTFFFFGGLLGLLLLWLPQDRWRWWHLAALCCGTAFYGSLLLTGSELSRLTVVGLFAVPLAVVLFLRLFDDAVPGDIEPGAALIIGVWFLAALYMAYGGLRFLLLLGPPLGIACAVATGRLYTWVRSLAAGAVSWYQVLVNSLLVTVLVLLLFQPLRWGYTAAKNYTPKINDAWWESLTKIRNDASPDAIVNTWWDYGHWVKYVAERRVSSDGSSLLTHVPHWLGKALVTPHAGESLGVLRMLNCGSDATPQPEGRLGAYGKIRATGRDAFTAYAIVGELVRLDKTAAQAYLAQRGFPAATQADILRSTHCVPPESYLILSSGLLRTARSWVHLGRWDPRLVYLARQVRLLSKAEVITDLMERVGYSEPEAASLYAQAQTRASTRPPDNAAASLSAYLIPQWLPCHAAADQAVMVCDINAGMHPAGLILEAFVYHPNSPTDARLRVRHDHGTGVANTVSEETPAIVIIAAAQHKEEVIAASPTYADLGVLVDLPKQRILVGSPTLIRSTLTHLLFLDGRHAEHYEKFDDRTTDTGERVATWKINWPGH